MIHPSSKVGDALDWPSSLRSKDPRGDSETIAGFGRMVGASLPGVLSAVSRFGQIALSPEPVRLLLLRVVEVLTRR